MKVTLEEGREAFANWRRLGKRRGRASNALKRTAVHLLEAHSLQLVSDTLVVPVKRLKAWQEAINNPSSPPNTFVRLSPSRMTQNEGAIRLTLPHGIQVFLPSQSPKEASQFLSALVLEFSSCSI